MIIKLYANFNVRSLSKRPHKDKIFNSAVQQDRLFQNFFNFIFQLLAVQVLGDDRTVFVNQYGMRDAVDAIKSGTAVLPAFQVGQLRPGDIQVFYTFGPCIGFAIQRDADDIESLPL